MRAGPRTDTTYTVTFKAKNVAALDAAYATWAPEGHLDWPEASGSNFVHKKCNGSASLALDTVTAQHGVTEGVQSHVHLPLMMRTTTPLNSNDGNHLLYFTAAGHTPAALLVAAALQFTLTGAVVLLLVFRKRIAAHLRPAPAIGNTDNLD